MKWAKFITKPTTAGPTLGTTFCAEVVGCVQKQSSDSCSCCHVGDKTACIDEV